MTQPFLTQPLEKGERVGLDVLTAGQPGAPELRTAYDAPCDVVLVAVPPGQGMVVEHFLERVFGLRTDVSPAKRRNEEAEHAD